MEFLSEYGLFLAKSITVVVALLIIVASIAALGSRNRVRQEGRIEVKSLNHKFDDMEDALKSVVLEQHDLKKEHKEEQKREKARKKAEKKNPPEAKKRVFVLYFDGDVKASQVDELREEVTAVLTLATVEDEVLLCLESPGGMVHGYGLAASQLSRIREHEIPLTVAVDKVAASGGYMMACIANKIIAAPFAILGSIGVVAQLPNFHRLLKKNDVDYEMLTAGEYKRTLTMFGENTDKGREKFVQELEDTHQLFKDFVVENRPQLDISAIATGEVWYGQRAVTNQLIDAIQTSDEYLLARRSDFNLFEVRYSHKKSIQERIGMTVAASVDRVIDKLLQRELSSRSRLH